jgi:hypothetical protein
MSSRNVSHQQLAMWYTPGEIKHMVGNESIDRRKDESIEQMWNRKADEARIGDPKHSRTPVAHSRTLTQSVAAQGVKQPVRLMRDTGRDRTILLDGHHRVAAAAEVNPSMLIPAIHHEDNIKHE